MRNAAKLGLSASVAVAGLVFLGLPAQAASTFNWTSDGSGVAGVTALGTWSCSSTSCSVSGNVYDTLGDSRAVAINYRWTTDCCAVRVKNEKGAGSNVPFSTSHAQKTGLHFEVQELRYNALSSQTGKWVRLF